MNTSELIKAHKSLTQCANPLVDCKLRLEGSQYEKDIERIWRAVERLNNKLIKEIRRKKT